VGVKYYFIFMVVASTFSLLAGAFFSLLPFCSFYLFATSTLEEAHIIIHSRSVRTGLEPK